MPEHVPELSVGMIAGELRERAAKGLQLLLAQSAIGRMEILVLDMNPHAGPLEGAEHERVTYLPRPDFQYYCDAQAELVKQARAPLLAFIEDHSYASPGWAEAVLNEFRNPAVNAVNYTFVPAGKGYLSRSILMSEYGQWMAPHPGGPIGCSSSTNIAYRREELLGLMQSDPEVMEVEFLIHRAIQHEGGQIRVASGATVAHESWEGLWDACRANGANKQVLGARRAANGGWGMPKRLIWAAGMALMPAFGSARLGWSLRSRPALWATYLAALPVIAIIYSYCAWREAKGYLMGAGGSREAFRALELDIKRDG